MSKIVIKEITKSEIDTASVFIDIMPEIPGLEFNSATAESHGNPPIVLGPKGVVTRGYDVDGEPLEKAFEESDSLKKKAKAILKLVKKYHADDALYSITLTMKSK